MKVLSFLSLEAVAVVLLATHASERFEALSLVPLMVILYLLRLEECDASVYGSIF